MKESLGRDKALHGNFAGKTAVVNNQETQRNFRCLTNASPKLSMEVPSPHEISEKDLPHSYILRNRSRNQD